MKTKRLAIFDLDGTLVNTIADLATAVNYALAQNNFPTHPMENYKMFVGNGINKLFERALLPTHATQENIDLVRADFLLYYSEHSNDFSRPYDGIMELLDELERRGVMLAVASNKYHQATVEVIKNFFPRINFVAVFGHRDNVAPKPEPQIVFDVLKIAGVTASEAIYIGDSGVDMQTAINSSVDAVGVTWGFRSVEELREFAPRYIVDTPVQILSCIDGNPTKD